MPLQGMPSFERSQEIDCTASRLDDRNARSKTKKPSMTQHLIWKDQCAAAKAVRQRHGIRSALDYLIGEKLLRYAELAALRPEFAQELPRFVGEVRSQFSQEELREYLATHDPLARPLPAGVSPDWLDEPETPIEQSARSARADVITELLLAPRLGTA